ncbi:DUF4880 domain-containing protein [Sphingomonas sp. LR60]|uniref:DUF4880 domain-containing protein n=1 Tax=Sphingomonas sp. LR60 TaxID=3050233 RepID=UPI002FE3F734
MSTAREQAIDDQAIAWCLRLHEGDPSTAEQQALDAWLAQDPAHRERFARTRRLWDGIALDAHAPELLPLRQQALAAVQVAGRRRWTPRAEASRHGWHLPPRCSLRSASRCCCATARRFTRRASANSAPWCSPTDRRWCWMPTARSAYGSATTGAT